MHKQLALLTTLMICPAIIAMGQSVLVHRRSLSESDSPKLNKPQNALLLQPYNTLDTGQTIADFVKKTQKHYPKPLQQLPTDTLIANYANTKKAYWWGPEEWKKNIVLFNGTKILGLVLYTLIHKKLCCIPTGYVVQVDLIAIDPQETQQGYESELLRALEKKARILSIDLMTASYQITNALDQAFFNKHQFQEIQNDGTLVTVQKKLNR